MGGLVLTLETGVLLTHTLWEVKTLIITSLRRNTHKMCKNGSSQLFANTPFMSLLVSALLSHHWKKRVSERLACSLSTTLLSPPLRLPSKSQRHYVRAQSFQTGPKGGALQTSVFVEVGDVCVCVLYTVGADITIRCQQRPVLCV